MLEASENTVEVVRQTSGRDPIFQISRMIIWYTPDATYQSLVLGYTGILESIIIELIVTDSINTGRSVIDKFTSQPITNRLLFLQDVSVSAAVPIPTVWA